MRTSASLVFVADNRISLSSPPVKLDARANYAPSSRKFGKQIQKRQLEVPEYAASFVNYKALKKVCVARAPRREEDRRQILC